MEGLFLPGLQSETPSQKNTTKPSIHRFIHSFPNEMDANRIDASKVCWSTLTGLTLKEEET